MQIVKLKKIHSPITTPISVEECFQLDSLKALHFVLLKHYF